MPRAGFLDENRGRGYQLVALVTGKQATGGGPPPVNPGSMQYLPTGVVVDYGAVVGSQINYDLDAHRIYLHRVSRTASTIEFAFRSTCPDLLNYEQVFCRNIDETRWASDYADASIYDSEAPAQSEPDCDAEPVWTGFLVTGDIADLLAVLTAAGQALYGDDVYVIEPALVRSLYGNFLNSVNLANADRTRAQPATGCRDYCYDFTPADMYVQETCVRGHIRFKEGFNLAITQSINDNSLTFSARKGSGAGEPCNEVPLFAGESEPAGSSLLTGGPTCEETVRSINGAFGRSLTIAGGTGVTVIPSLAARHQLDVNIDLHDLAICQSEEPSEEPCLEPDPNPDPCDCGSLESE